MRFKDKYTVGNVCLVVFLAFIFSLIIATVKVQPAAAAPAMTMPQQGTGMYDSTTGAVRINITLSPVSATNFGSLRYYIRLVNEVGTPVSNLGTTDYVYFSPSSSSTISGTVYDNLVSLLYMAGSPVNLAPTFGVVYSTLSQTSTPDTVYLTLIYRPPTSGSGSGGGGGGGGGSTTFTGSAGTINVDVAAGVTTLQTNADSLGTMMTGQITNQTPSVSQTTVTTDTTTVTQTEVTFTINLVPETSLLQPNTSVSLTSDAINLLARTLADLTAQQTQNQAPNQNVTTRLEVQIPFAGGTLTLDVAQLVAQVQQMQSATPNAPPGQLPEVVISVNTTGSQAQISTADGYTAASSTVQVSVGTLVNGQLTPLEINGELSMRPASGALLAALASDAPAVSAAPRRMQFLKLTLQYDPHGVLDPNRLAAQFRDINGNSSFVPRVVVNQEKREADLYLDQAGYVSMVQWVKDFSDIGQHWASQDIIQLAARGVVNGYPDGKFDPNGSVTRAQFAAMVLRSLGVNMVKPATPKFSDVAGWSWYYQAVETASRLGLVNGYGDGSFKPNARITRAEMSTIIMRAENLLKDVTVTTAESTDLLKPFSDANQLPVWARESAAKALKTSIVQGRTQTTFQPLSDATRAESVVMLKRLLKYNGHIQ